MTQGQRAGRLPSQQPRRAHHDHPQTRPGPSGRRPRAPPRRAHEPAVHAADGAAIGGIDPVGYFDEGRPVEGSPAHELAWDGATWRFASARNAERFEADPRAFAPRYGGTCAWAVSEGYLAPIDPDAWTIHEGRLYLNASRGIRRRWSRDIPGHVARADANWPGVLE